MNTPLPASRHAPAWRIAAILVFASALPARSDGAEDPAVDANPPTSRERSFERLPTQDTVPSVRAIVPIDGANVFFLDRRGQVGIAKFTPGLGLIGWERYSEVNLNALPFLALGPSYSVLTASPTELTQSFDTDQDGSLDFFQSLLRDWPGRDDQVRITAGPVGDSFGRVLLALSPHSATADDPPKARLVAWNPATGVLVTMTESELPIRAFAVNRDGLVAARLEMPDYRDGYYLSLTELPPFDPEQPDAVPETMPFTRPSLIIPAELAKNEAPTQLCFTRESEEERILLSCPASRHLIEVVPERSGNVWQGSILLRAKTPKPVEALVEMRPGLVLCGGDEGFLSLAEGDEKYRIRRIARADDGIVLEFNREVDRFHAAKAESYSVKSFALDGGETTLEVTPVIESDGSAVILKTDALRPGTVLRVVCQNIPSASGESLLSSAAFFTLHRK